MQVEKDLTALRDRMDDPPAGVILLSDEDVHNEILLLEQSQALVNQLSRELGLFGYSLRSVTDSDGLIAALLDRPANAVIVDLDAAGSAEALEQLLIRVRDSSGRMLPVLGISHSNDFHTRLKAVRTGVASYLRPPIDPHDLVMELDLLTHRGVPDRLRVLLVESSSTRAAEYRTVLEGGGLAVTVVRQPEQAMVVLQEFSPDVILMAMYLDECTGAELARVIRQFPAHTTIPIVFLGPQTAMDRQLDAIGVGGDDFLSGPIHGSYLVRFVTIRAERGRKLRSLILTDNLTGLLNHSRIKEQLGKELARAERRGTPLAFAMVDLDYFKAVNDTYGHQAGDRVIKTMARLFKQRLRRSDYIGRYGGEEFAVIMPDSTAEDAKRTMDEIRNTFGRIGQVAWKGTFRASFSAGVAAFPEVGNPTELTRCADQALYDAKRNGRDRVVNYQAMVSNLSL
ncbi:MAG: diguanylate cyclase [Nitrococcus sp.]|nr:diguanylate cyclase [Nitrococcus sp.]